MHLDYTKTAVIDAQITITGSKSESNRLLLLQQLYPGLEIENLSNADDTKVLQKALQSPEKIIDIGHAGTAMRFLTAYYACQSGTNKILTGSARMKQRPIELLVNALQYLGSSITYIDKQGYPPLQISGKTLTKNELSIPADKSSQYISALLLIAPSLQNGLKLNLEGTITSKPYIEMTLALLDRIGVESVFDNGQIQVFPLKNTDFKGKKIRVEADWSSASYFYSLVALHPQAHIKLNGYEPNSLQGDSVLPEIYRQLGVQTHFTQEGILLQSNRIPANKYLELNLINTPDLAQTLAVTCMGLGIDCMLTGLHTLKIKETDRLQALKNELEKLGGRVSISSDSLGLKSPEKLLPNITITTYEDHRMAMAFAPLAVKVPLHIANPEIVSKSYPDFWRDFKSLFVS